MVPRSFDPTKPRLPLWIEHGFCIGAASKNDPLSVSTNSAVTQVNTKSRSGSVWPWNNDLWNSELGGTLGSINVATTKTNKDPTTLPNDQFRGAP